MCYFLEKKDRQAALDAFKQYKAWAENQTGKHIMTLCTDRGGEYVNRKFMEFMVSNGIAHEKTMWHTPQSNGLAERMNCTLARRQDPFSMAQTYCINYGVKHGTRQDIYLRKDW